MQNEADGQKTLRKPEPVSICAGADQLAAPPAGFVEVSMFPSPSTATHSCWEGQDMPLSRTAASICPTLHAPVGGSADVRARPAWSTATHRDVDGHETPSISLDPSTFADFQALLPPVGFVEVTASPEAPTPTQRDADGQDMLNRRTF
jgi:hypothetical protein